MSEYIDVSEIFGEDVFNDVVMQQRLPKKVYKDLKQTILEGEELSLEMADVIAHEMKEWAIEKGATHYTHWFQPLTGVTAEKHDSFITAPLPNGKVLMSFSGKELIKESRTHLLFRQEDCVLLLKHEAIQHGTVLLRLLCVMMRQELPYVFLRHFALIQGKRWIRRHRCCVPCRQSIHRLFA